MAIGRLFPLFPFGQGPSEAIESFTGTISAVWVPELILKTINGLLSFGAGNIVTLLVHPDRITCVILT